MRKRVIAIAFFLILLLMTAGELLTDSKGFSEMENRYLAVKPKASWREIRSGKYMEGLEDYLADQVPLRDQWIQTKNTLERASGRSQIGNICFAPQDRLVQVQDISFDQLTKNLDSLKGWMEKLPETVSVDFLLAPNASWVYQDQLPRYTLSYDPEEALNLMQQKLPERVQLISAYETLQAHRDEDIYFKSDHHWTMRGAAYAYMALEEKSPDAYGLAQADLLQRESHQMGENFKGSLYSQAPTYGYPGEDFWVLDSAGLDAQWEAEGKQGTLLMSEAFAEKDQYKAFLGGNYGLTRVYNAQAEKQEKILVLKDSYANILLPFLAERYQEIVMVDLRFYRGNVQTLLEEEQMQQVLCIYNMDFLCTDQNFLWLNSHS